MDKQLKTEKELIELQRFANLCIEFYEDFETILKNRTDNEDFINTFTTLLRIYEIRGLTFYYFFIIIMGTGKRAKRKIKRGGRQRVKRRRKRKHPLFKPPPEVSKYARLLRTGDAQDRQTASLMLRTWKKELRQRRAYHKVHKQRSKKKINAMNKKALEETSAMYY